MRVLVALLCLLALEQIVAPTRPLGNRVLFVLDCSGSMSGGSFRRAMAETRAIAGQPTDDLEVSVITFADQVESYPGGWVKLPDAEALEELHTWISGQLVPTGNTRVIPALERALRVQRRALTVVLVTDGMFAEVDSAVLEAIKAAQAARKQRATVAVLGIGTPRDVLEQIGRVGAGGYFSTQGKD